MGVSWTWFTGYVDSVGNPFLWDYASWDSGSTPSEKVIPEVHVSILANQKTYGEFCDDRYNPCLEGGMFVKLSDPATIQYQVRLILPMESRDVILLETPVFDDITLYWRSSSMEILEACLE